MFIHQSIALILLPLTVSVCLLGCGGSSRSGSPDQLAALQQIQTVKTDPNVQLMAQVNRTDFGWLSGL